MKGAATRPRATALDYLWIARPSHWVKHIFIVPGIALAALLQGTLPSGFAGTLLIGFASAALVASANYVLNEWLDREFDAHHPIKSTRPNVQRSLSPLLVWSEYALLALFGLLLAGLLSRLFLVASALFLISGWAYNVRPLRLKDRATLDVVTEALNNPIRLVLGWAMVDGSTLPPSSLALSYWLGGAFLMTIKRLAERRTVIEAGGGDRLARYRRSFGSYTEAWLLVQALTCAVLASFLLAVFLVKYRIEYLLAVPLLAALFARYLALGLKPGSAVEAPERLFRETGLVALVVALVVVLALLTWWDVPGLERLTDPHYIKLGGD